MKTLDMFGNQIQPGDYINYPVRTGSNLYMRTAKVKKITVKDEQSVLHVAMAKAPRSLQRKLGYLTTEVINTVVNNSRRATIIPKAYVQNDSRYACLLEQ